jgi:hypothetical protein
MQPPPSRLFFGRSRFGHSRRPLCRCGGKSRPVVGAAGRGARSMRRSQSRVNRMRNLAAVNSPLGLPQRTTRLAAHRMGQSERLGSGDPHPYAIPNRAEGGPGRATRPTDRRQHSSCRDVGRRCTRRCWLLPAGVGVDRRPVRVQEPLERQALPLVSRAAAPALHATGRPVVITSSPTPTTVNVPQDFPSSARPGGASCYLAHHKACGQRRGDGWVVGGLARRQRNRKGTARFA